MQYKKHLIQHLVLVFFSVSYDERKLKLSITAESQSELKLTNLKGLMIAPVRLVTQTICEQMSFWVLILHSLKQRGRLNLVLLTWDVFIMLNISSASLSSFKTLGPRGESNIIKKFLLQHMVLQTIFNNIVDSKQKIIEHIRIPIKRCLW